MAEIGTFEFTQAYERNPIQSSVTMTPDEVARYIS